MTREEAINNLRDLWNEVYNEDSDGYNYAVAIDMAIEALSADITPHKQKWVCDNCGYKIFKIGTIFCPNCGNNLKGDDE